jgi:hypothetical protein
MVVARAKGLPTLRCVKKVNVHGAVLITIRSLELEEEEEAIGRAID